MDAEDYGEFVKYCKVAHFVCVCALFEFFFGRTPSQKQ